MRTWKPYLVSVAVLAVLITLPRPASAQTAACDALSGAKRSLALDLLKSQHPYDCCDGTIWACLHKKPVCRLAKRLANDVCRRAKAGQSKATITRELSRRATSMTGRKYSIDLSDNSVAGDPGAKVTVVAYLCARCPYCARLGPALYRSVTSGRLKGKAKFYVRAFPIRSHQHSTEGGMAMMAAHKLGRFWDLLLHLYANFDRFDPAKLPDCAAAKGMDPARFSQLLGDRTLRAKLVASKKEGVRNNVDATPTLYLNGRKYTADLSVAAVEDAIEEEYERMTGKKHE
jgi:protein-disulfide isomerase